MAEETALTTVVPGSIDEVMMIGKAMAASGFFPDIKSISQATVKILAGKELGFGPFASMVGINIIKGKASTGGNLMAAKVKNHPRYDYRVAQMSNDICELVFFEDGKEIGRSIFTKEDAIAAEVGKLVAPGASGNMLKRFPRNMLFNRAISNGLRWFCPDVFMGAPVYTPGELDIPVDDEGSVISVTPTVIEPTAGDDGGDKPPEDVGSNGQHWIDKTDKQGQPIRARFWAWAKTDRALTKANVYAALGVEHVHDFTGTMDDAKVLIDAWIIGKAEAQTGAVG